MQAQGVANLEASHKTKRITEAGSAIQRHRSEIVKEAEQTLQQQGTLAKQEMKHLFQRVKIAEESLEQEKSSRVHAGCDLQRTLQLLEQEKSSRRSAEGDPPALHPIKQDVADEN